MISTDLSFAWLLKKSESFNLVDGSSHKLLELEQVMGISRGLPLSYSDFNSHNSTQSIQSPHSSFPNSIPFSSPHSCKPFIKCCTVPRFITTVTESGLSALAWPRAEKVIPLILTIRAATFSAGKRPDAYLQRYLSCIRSSVGELLQVVTIYHPPNFCIFYPP